MSKDGRGEFKLSSKFENRHGTTDRMEIKGSKQAGRVSRGDA